MATDQIKPQQSEFLNSWKEIANYMGRGVRTVQRYEYQFGLPVRRPSAKSRGSVIARRVEIDNWIAKSPMRGGANQPLPDDRVCPYCCRSRSVKEDCHSLIDDDRKFLRQRSTSQLALNKSGVQFLKVDLSMARTFAEIALQADNDEKRQRNQRYARKGYDTIVGLIPKLGPPVADAEILENELGLLKSELMKLGDRF